MAAVPQIRRKQQGGVPAGINKARAYAVMVSGFGGFDDPGGKKRNRLLSFMLKHHGEK
jgi:hypothetical protein